MARISCSLLMLTIVLSFCSCSNGNALRSDDFRRLEAGTWKGSLTYLDYSSGKKTTIPVNLSVERIKQKESAWEFSYRYPDEPHANGLDTIRVSADGTMLNDESVVERQVLADGSVRIVTIKHGTDNGKRASIRHIYIIDTGKYTITKEVKYDGEESYFERNTYEWKRVAE